MKRKSLTRCESEGCNNLATVIGGKRLYHCLEHLTQLERESVSQHIEKGKSLQCSVFDGRSATTSCPYSSIGFEFPKEVDLKGSIFVNIDLNSADLTRVDFSFCTFKECDLRRSRLFNSSLRWAVFNQSLLRQADISNADCRWLDSSHKKEDCVGTLRKQLSYLENRYTHCQNSLLHIIGRNDAKLFFSRHGFEVNENECNLFEEQKYDTLLGCLFSDDAKQCWNGEYCSLDQEHCLKNKNSNLPETDWSGASFKDSDLAYSNFDNSIAYEVAFDGSDLHGASFCNAKIQRSSFVNVSFSRVDKAAPYRSRFKNAQMQECVLESANLSGLYFQEANLNYAKMRNAHIENAVFFECSLAALDASDAIADGCRFYASDMSSGSFKAASLRKTSFSFDGVTTGLQLDSEVHRELIARWNILVDVERSSKLIAANIVAADLEEANLSSCNLAGASLQSANLRKANLTGSTCAGTNFNACNVGGVNFTKANLIACSLSDVGIDADPPIFNETNLSSTNFSGMDLSKVAFVNSTMENANFADCSLAGASFRGKNKENMLIARRSSFSNSDFTDASFEYVDLDSCDMSLIVARKSDHRFSFTTCKLSVIKFSGSSLVGGDFTNCEITKSNLSDSYLEDIKLNICNLESTSFSGSDLNSIKILNPKSISDVDFSSSNIINGSTICIDESLDPIEAQSISWDKAYAKELTLSNIHFIALNADYSAFENIELDGVCFSTSSFNTALVKVSAHRNSHFFYCKFPLAKLSIPQIPQSDNEQNFIVFLGCNFIETSLPYKPDFIHFVDCYFRLSSFLATPEGVKNWSKATLVYCRFEDLKYFGLNEEYCKILDKTETLSFKKFLNKVHLKLLLAAKELANRFPIARRLNDLLPNKEQLDEDNALSFKEFLNKVRLTLSESVEQLLAAKELANRFPIARRLNALLPNKEQLEREQGYGLTSALCLQFRRDFKNQSFEELTTHARVEEQDYLLNLKVLQLRSKFAKFAGSIVAKISTWIVLPLILFLSLFLSQLVDFWSGLAFLFPFTLILPAFFSAGRLFVSRHLYKYGEHIITMACSVAVCIVSYAILYYGFMPEDNGKLCTSIIESKPGIYKLVPNFFEPAFSNSTITGCLTTGVDVLTKNGDWVQAFLTCLYYSGVTFTTLGYGDISPQGLVRYLAFSEAMIGAFMIALLVFVFTKRDN